MAALLTWSRKTLLVLMAASALCGPGTARAACTLPSGAVLTQASSLRLGAQAVQVAALSLADPNHSRARLLVLDNRCHALLDETVDGLESRFDVRRLGRTRLLQFVTMQVFGDGTGYVHRLFVMHNGRLIHLLPPIAHTGKDGFYLGPLTGDRGDGVVTWIADPRAEAEADAHPYVISVWRWRNGRLVGPVTHETTGKYLPSANVVPRSNVVAQALGLAYRDQTRTDKFMDPGQVMKLQGELEQRGQ